MYIIGKDELGYSTFSQIYSKPTDASNGTRVKIAISMYDEGNFKKGCLQQLAYFDNVFIVVDGKPYEEYNQAKRHVFKNFTYVEGFSVDRSTHIKLGQVYYKIDINKLVNTYQYTSPPIALNFEIGELQPTPNRESIILTEEAKSLIKTKYQDALKELNELYKSQLKDLSWSHWYELARGYKRKGPKIGEDFIDISNNYSTAQALQPNGITIGYINSSLFLKHWSYFRKINDTGMSVPSSNETFNPMNLEGSGSFLTISQDHDKHRNKYIAETFKNSVLLIKRTKLNLKDYIKLLGLSTVNKAEWRNAIKEYQKLEEEIWESIPKYKDVKVPDAWRKAQYKKRVTRDLSGKMIVYRARVPDRASENYAAYDKNTLEIQEVLNTRGFIVYGQKSDREELDKIFMLTQRFRRVAVIYTASHNHKYLEEMENAIHVDNFKSWNRVFSKAITGYQIRKFKNENEFFFNNIDYLNKLKAEYGAVFESLNKYLDDYAIHLRGGPDEFYEACWNVAFEKKLYDHTAFDKLQKAQKLITNLEDLKYLKRSEETYYRKISGCLCIETLPLAKRIIKPYINLI